MKAMIFAAGIGSRLGQLTQNTPKCLMPLGSTLGSRTILEHVITRLKAAGVNEVVINLHHFPERVTDYMSRHSNFGLTVHYSHEPTLLDTGGGFKKVRSFFRDDPAFFVHNADIYCTFDLMALLNAHKAHSAVATLGVMQRESKRGVYMNSASQITGWTEEKTTQPADSTLYAFSGISVCSFEIFSYMPDSDNTFSIIKSFLAAARSTGEVYGLEISSAGWVDIGSPERLTALQNKLKASDR